MWNFFGIFDRTDFEIIAFEGRRQCFFRPYPTGSAAFDSGMSKRTSYDKIYHPDIRGRHLDVCTHPRLPRGRVYPADAFLSTNGFLPSVRTVKNVSVRTRLCVRADIGTSVRTSSSPCPRLPSVPPRSPCANGLLRPRGRMQLVRADV
jgi:hypothetical protein